MNTYDELEVRQELPGDIDQIYTVNEAAFERENEARLVSLLRSEIDFSTDLSFVAIKDEMIVAHVMFSTITIRDEEGNEYTSLGLAPMSVLPGMQRLGIGSTLLKRALNRLIRMGYTSVFVLGHPDYYPRFGFRQSADFGIKTAFDIPEIAFMALELVPGSLRGVTGVAEYASAFAEV